MRKLLRNNLLFSLFFLSSLQLCLAQSAGLSQNIRFKKLSIEQGLSQSVVNCILQDSRDFLWFGTQDGLNMYNGKNFVYFKHDFLDSTSISSSSIKCMFESRQGSLWIGTENGLNVYNPLTGKIKSYKHDPFNIKSISSNNITYLYQDKSDRVWVGTGDNGLCRFDVEKGEVNSDYLKHQQYNKSTLSNNKVTSIYEDRSGLLWVGTEDGLSVYDKNTEIDTTKRKSNSVEKTERKEKFKFQVYKHDDNDPNSLASNQVNCIYQTLNGLIFIGTSDGLSVFNPETKKITNYKTAGDNFNINDITCLFEDRSGKLWIGTKGEGLCVFDQYSKTFTCFKSDPDNPYSLSKPYVFSIYEDKSGTIWIGTWGGGLCSYNPYFDRFKIIQKKTGDSNSITSSDISSVCEDNKGNIWIGTFGYGLNKYNSSSEINKVFVMGPQSISDNTINHLYEDAENSTLWIGTPNGLNALDLKTDKIQLFKNDPKNIFSLSNNDVNVIYKDGGGVIWVGTSNGLNALNLDQKKFRRYSFTGGNSTSAAFNDITSVHEDHEGKIWVGTNGSGIRMLDPITGDIKTYQYSEKDKRSLSNNIINNIYEDGDSVLWVSTSNGLNGFDPEINGFEYFTEHEGLPNNVVYGIVEDNNKKLWLATNNGLCSFISPTRQRIESLKNNDGAEGMDTKVEVVNPMTKVYDIRDGLPSNEFNARAFCKGYNGNLYFGSISGLVGFNPDSLQTNPYVPPVYLTSFKLNENEYAMDTTIMFKKVIELNYDENYFSFEFITLNFIASEKNEYWYILEGVDKDWKLSGQINFVNYNNVDPGTYTFRVKAANNDGVPNEEGTSVTIIIKPPFWRTNWFYLLCFLFLVARLYWYIKWRESSLTVQKKILEKKVAERTRQLKKEKDRVEIAYLQIDNKNKEITDSIKYAKRLQEAILTPEDEVKKHLPESFILYKPKDIVSGDFYYFNKAQNGSLIMAAVDCTGHGVPGAFMSIVGNNLLNQSIITNKKTKPAEILDELNTGLSETLKQTLTEASVKDGMDMALCTIDPKGKKIQYAGAYNPIWLIRKGIVDSDLVLDERAFPVDKDMLEIRADKFPVGKFIDDEPHLFTNHEMQLKTGDTFYIFSDGYADQFGGMKGKKFKYKRLRDLLLSIQDKSMVEQKIILDRRLENWKGELEQVDDILIIGVRMT